MLNLAELDPTLDTDWRSVYYALESGYKPLVTSYSQTLGNASDLLTHACLNNCKQLARIVLPVVTDITQSLLTTAIKSKSIDVAIVLLQSSRFDVVQLGSHAQRSTMAREHPRLEPYLDVKLCMVPSTLRRRVRNPNPEKVDYLTGMNQDVLSLVCVDLLPEDMHRLSTCSKDMRCSTTKLSNTERVWFLMLQQRLGKSLAEIEEASSIAGASTCCWKRAYHLVIRSMNWRNRLMLTCTNELAVRVLLHIGVDPSLDDNQAFKSACSIGQAEVVKLLLADERVDPTADKNDALSQAVLKGRCEIVKLLLADKRVDPRIKHRDISSVLVTACERGYEDMVELLLQDERIDTPEARKLGLTAAFDMRQRHIVALLS